MRHAEIHLSCGNHFKLTVLHLNDIKLIKMRIFQVHITPSHT